MPRIKIKRGTTSQWNSSTTPLLSGELGLDITLNKLKAGNGSSLWTNLPFLTSDGGGDTGDITFDGVQIIGAGTASGDGSNLGTIELVPDGDITSDQYLIIDPTAPNHIHIRAGGEQDASSADLFIGGERNHVRVSDGGKTVSFSTKPQSITNTYTNINSGNANYFVVANTAEIYEGDTGYYSQGGDIFTVDSIVQDSPSAGLITVTATSYGTLMPFIGGGAYVFIHDEGWNNNWYFDTNGVLNGPAMGSVAVNGLYNNSAAENDLLLGSSEKIIIAGSSGEFLNDASIASNQIATLGDLIPGIQGEPGADGADGAPGERGISALSWTYKAQTGVVNVDPGNDYLNFNADPFTSSTQIRVDDNPYGLNTTLHDLFLSIQSGYLSVTSQSDPSSYATFEIVSCVDGTATNETIDGSYVIFNVSLVSTYGAISNEDFVTLSLAPAGQQGEPGAQGDPGAQGEPGPQGDPGPAGEYPNYLGDYNNGVGYPIGGIVSINVGSPYGNPGQLFIKISNPNNPGYAPGDPSWQEYTQGLVVAGIPAYLPLKAFQEASNYAVNYEYFSHATYGNSIAIARTPQVDAYMNYAVTAGVPQIWKFESMGAHASFELLLGVPTPNTENVAPNKQIWTLAYDGYDYGDIAYLLANGNEYAVFLKKTGGTAGSSAAALVAANEYTDTAIAGLGNSIDDTYVPISLVGVADGVATLGSDGKIPDSEIPAGIARASDYLPIAEPSVDYYITNSGSGAYLVNGVSNGLITFEKGKKYRIHVNATGHPFWIQTVSGAYSSGNVYSTGITNGGAQAGHILVELPQDAPDSLYYACQYHSSMAGSISVQSDNTVTINSKASSYTILPIDSNRLIEMSAGGTLTITDSASFPVGFTCDILQTGASQVTIAGTSFTPNATPGLKLRTQWSSATLIKRALNSWVVLGDLSA
jgi:hypothetical protein